jgi:transposase
MDLSTTYRSLVRRYFPNAQIVADRFHVIRLINHHFLDAWKQLEPVGRKNRGLLSLMRRHEKNLTGEQRDRLRGYLKSHPGLEAVYDFKQHLCRLLVRKNLKKPEARRCLAEFLDAIQELLHSPLESLQRLGRTLQSWRTEIALMWRWSKNNGITEGFHTKMEMISRRAFGFKNFENYRLRVKVMCG